MAPGGLDWLAKTVEETLEPEIPICDPHHHFWVSRPEPVDYQRYLLPELSADVNSGHNVRSTVFIEVRCNYREDGPEEMRPVGEVEYIETIAAESADRESRLDAGGGGDYRSCRPQAGRGSAVRCWRRCGRPALAASGASVIRLGGTKARSWPTGIYGEHWVPRATGTGPGSCPVWGWFWKTLCISTSWENWPISPAPYPT